MDGPNQDEIPKVYVAKVKDVMRCDSFWHFSAYWPSLKQNILLLNIALFIILWAPQARKVRKVNSISQTIQAGQIILE